MVAVVEERPGGQAGRPAHPGEAREVDGVEDDIRRRFGDTQFDREAHRQRRRHRHIAIDARMPRHRDAADGAVGKEDRRNPREADEGRHGVPAELSVDDVGAKRQPVKIAADAHPLGFHRTPLVEDTVAIDDCRMAATFEAEDEIAHENLGSPEKVGAQICDQDFHDGRARDARFTIAACPLPAAPPRAGRMHPARRPPW